MHRWQKILTLAGASLAVIPLVGSAGSAPGWQSHVSREVIAVYAHATAGSSTAAAPAAGNLVPTSRARFDAKQRLQVDVHFDCSSKPPTAALSAAGLVVGTTVQVRPMCVVEGWIAPSALPQLATVAGVQHIDLPSYAVRKTPPVGTKAPLPGAMSKFHAQVQAGGSSGIDAAGIAIMRADQFVQQTAVAGAGVTIGVMSDDATSLSVIQGRGELPNVQVIQPSSNPTVHSTLTDEGTVMLEEVYAVAPGATLYFCGPATYAEYVACAQNLIASGVTVISDDLGYPGFDVFTSPSQNQNGAPITSLLASNSNVMLFHSIGNDNQDYDQDSYNPIAIGGSVTCSASSPSDFYFHSFPGPTAYLPWTTNGAHDLLLASPVNLGSNVPNQLDVYVYNAAGFVACGTPAFVTGATSYTWVNGSSIPPGSYQLFVTSPDASLAGVPIKIFGFGDNPVDSFAFNSYGGAYSPQSFASAVLSVGAVNGSDGVGNQIEPFSVTGPITVQYPTAGSFLAPQLVAPDGVYVDSTGTNFSAGPFYGTSAASPNAAAVAALLRSAFPVLTPAQVTGYMESGATVLGSSAPDGTFGYGRVDAIGALNAIPAPSVSGFTTASIVGGKSSASLAITFTGTGAIHVSVVPASLIPSGSAGVNGSCGASQCTVVLTPAMGQSGTTAVQITATDGANRTASYQAMVTVTKPAPPVVTITAGGSQSVTTGGSISNVTFTVSGTGPLTVSPTSNDLSTVSISSGCGTTSMTCTATLGAASNTPGTATLTVTAQDSYAQSGAATASISVAAPASGGGGGSMDWLALIGLGGLFVRRVRTTNSSERVAEQRRKRGAEGP